MFAWCCPAASFDKPYRIAYKEKYSVDCRSYLRPAVKGLYLWINLQTKIAMTRSTFIGRQLVQVHSPSLCIDCTSFVKAFAQHVSLVLPRARVVFRMRSSSKQIFALFSRKEFFFFGSGTGVLQGVVARASFVDRTCLAGRDYQSPLFLPTKPNLQRSAPLASSDVQFLKTH